MCHLPSSLAVFWTRSNISAFSSAGNRLGTSPVATSTLMLILIILVVMVMVIGHFTCGHINPDADHHCAHTDHLRGDGGFKKSLKVKVVVFENEKVICDTR